MAIDVSLEGESAVRENRMLSNADMRQAHMGYPQNPSSLASEIIASCLPL